MHKKDKFYVLVALVVMGVIARLIPHIPNVTPVTAITLFVSTYVGVRYAIPVIIGLMLISDISIGFYSWPIMLSVYGSLALSGLLGIYLRKNKTTTSLFVSTLAASLAFFLITNWAVWQFGTMYPHSWKGLVECFTMAIPFFRNSLMGDLFYTAFLFGIFEICLLIKRKLEGGSYLLFK